MGHKGGQRCGWRGQGTASSCGGSPSSLQCCCSSQGTGQSLMQRPSAPSRRLDSWMLSLPPRPSGGPCRGLSSFRQPSLLPKALFSFFHPRHLSQLIWSIRKQARDDGFSRPATVSTNSETPFLGDISRHIV